jgi:PAS domain S-box-containing protein/putative nucleotidyltransferase with HDIG domain
LGEIKVLIQEDYFRNIFNTVREGILVLDENMRVLSANRSFFNIFKVDSANTIGSLLYDLGNGQWDIPNLRVLLEDILPKNDTVDNFEIEHNFQSIGQKTMLLNACKIREKKNDLPIILLAIEDITERREIENGLEKTRKQLGATKISEDEAREYAESIINTVREPLIALDQDLRVVSASRSFYEGFKVNPKETVGQLIYDLGNKQWNIPKLRELLETILPQKTTFDNYEVEHVFSTIGRRIMLLNARQIKRVSGKERIILLAIEDITERKRLESLLEESEVRYRRVFETASDAILLLEKREGEITHANPAAEKMLGYSMKECIGKKLQNIGVELDVSDFQTIMQTLNRSGIINYVDVPVRTKSGQHIDTDIYMVDRAMLAQCNIRDVTERKLAEKRTYRQLQKLSALHSIDLTISSSLDIRMTLKIFLDHVVTQLSVDAANVLLLNPHTRTLEYAASRGFQTSALRHSHLRLGEGYAGVAALENRVVRIPNLKEENNVFARKELLKGEDFITYYGVPLVAKGRVKGVLEIFHRSPLEPNEEWFEFLDALALQAAIAIDNNSLFYELERSNMGLILAYDSTIEGWSRALDYRDKETEGHSQRVTEITINIAREVGMNEEELVHVRRGALLHDIGKMGIPDSILLKPGALTDEEWKIMRLHPVYSYELLHPIDYLRPALDIPYCHHENWDGSGYPRGLKGEQIPLSARIFAVVDVWDALRSDRPYRRPWTEEKTKEYILSLSGIQFDPKVVEVFFRAIPQKKD